VALAILFGLSSVIMVCTVFFFSLSNTKCGKAFAALSKKKLWQISHVCSHSGWSYLDMLSFKKKKCAINSNYLRSCF
jgi:hypothetical protein